MMVAVELVYDKDCPNVGEARASLRQALTEVGLPAEWTEWEASSPSTPAHGRRLGSRGPIPATPPAVASTPSTDEGVARRRLS